MSNCTNIDQSHWDLRSNGVFPTLRVFSGPQVTPPSSAPEKTAADGGTTAVTQPTPTEGTTGAAPTPNTWPSTAQTTAWCGWTGRAPGTPSSPCAWRSDLSSSSRRQQTSKHPETHANQTPKSLSCTMNMSGCVHPDRHGGEHAAKKWRQMDERIW